MNELLRMNHDASFMESTELVHNFIASNYNYYDTQPKNTFQTNLFTFLLSDMVHRFPQITANGCFSIDKKLFPTVNNCIHYISQYV